jgi:hypothetical protein
MRAIVPKDLTGFNNQSVRGFKFVLDFTAWAEQVDRPLHFLVFGS